MANGYSSNWHLACMNTERLNSHIIYIIYIPKHVGMCKENFRNALIKGSSNHFKVSIVNSIKTCVFWHSIFVCVDVWLCLCRNIETWVLTTLEWPIQYDLILSIFDVTWSWWLFSFESMDDRKKNSNKLNLSKDIEITFSSESKFQIHKKRTGHQMRFAKFVNDIRFECVVSISANVQFVSTF